MSVWIRSICFELSDLPLIELFSLILALARAVPAARHRKASNILSSCITFHWSIKDARLCIKSFLVSSENIERRLIIDSWLVLAVLEPASIRGMIPRAHTEYKARGIIDMILVRKACQML